MTVALSDITDWREFWGIYNITSDYCATYLKDYKSNEESQIYRLVFFGLCFLSVFGLAFVAITIFSNKKLQAHPQMLIAYICVAEACMSFNGLVQVIGPVYFICYAGLEQIYAYTMPGNNRGLDQNSLTCSLNLLCSSNGIMFQGFQLLSLMLNICLCVDLILTIKSPFTPASSRSKFYYLASAALPLMLVFIIYGADSANANDCISCIQNYPAINSKTVSGTVVQGAGNMILAITLTCYLIVASYSCVFAIRRLNRPGVSKDIRIMFVKKHFLYVLVFIVVWVL
jgi:hypothetical protein